MSHKAAQHIAGGTIIMYHKNVKRVQIVQTSLTKNKNWIIKQRKAFVFIEKAINNLVFIYMENIIQTFSSRLRTGSLLQYFSY